MPRKNRRGLICPRGHRGPYQGGLCVHSMPERHRLCRERLVSEPEVRRCPCGKGIFVPDTMTDTGDWCSYCGRAAVGRSKPSDEHPGVTHQTPHFAPPLTRANAPRSVGSGKRTWRWEHPERERREELFGWPYQGA